MLENMLESFLKGVITIEEFTSFLEANDNYSEKLTEAASELIQDSSKFEEVDTEVEEANEYETRHRITYKLAAVKRDYYLTISYKDSDWGETPEIVTQVFPKKVTTIVYKARARHKKKAGNK